MFPFLILKLFSSFESFLWILGFGSDPVHFSFPRGLWDHPWACCPCSQVLVDTCWNSCVALQADSCAIPEFDSKDTNPNEKCGRSWSGNGSRKGAALSFCHCLHPAWLWLISSCSRFCLIQEGFCLTNARYYVRLWLQPAKGHSVWLKSFAKNCTWEHAVPSGCYENSSSTKCRTLPKKNLPTTG